MTTKLKVSIVGASGYGGGELLRLLTDIVDSARLEAGKLVVVRAWTPSVEILTEAVSQGRELVGERDLRLEVELQPGLPPVFVDRQRIVQAVVGLLGHATQSTPKGVIGSFGRSTPLSPATNQAYEDAAEGLI